MEMIGYLSVDKPRRLHRSAKNGKLIAYTEYGKVIIIKNQKVFTMALLRSQATRMPATAL